MVGRETGQREGGREGGREGKACMYVCMYISFGGAEQQCERVRQEGLDTVAEQHGESSTSGNRRQAEEDRAGGAGGGEGGIWDTGAGGGCMVCEGRRVMGLSVPCGACLYR